MTDTESTKLVSKKYAAYGPILGRAMATVQTGGVKEHRFRPSGRVLRTVVGRLGDEFIDPERPYCSCSDFFFRVLNGKSKLCYHLLSHSIATELGRIEVVVMDDEEYGQFYSLIVKDVFSVLYRSGGAPSLRLP